MWQKRNFEDMINQGSSAGERILDYLVGPNALTSVPERGSKGRLDTERKQSDMEAAAV